MDYVVHILVLIAIYSILTFSLDLLVGHTGILSLAHAAFYGLGAYTSALLALRAGAPFSVCIVAAMVLAVLVSFAVSIPSFRLQDDYLVLAIFGFQMIVSSLFTNLQGLTGGPLGLAGIPQPHLLEWTIGSHLGFLLLTSISAGLTFVIVRRISGSPFGRVLHAIREDELLAKALGKNTLRFKIAAFAISAALAALAGSLYASYISYIDPTAFDVMQSVLVVAMVIIGGAGSVWGPLVGAVVLVALPEALRFLGLPYAAAANLRQVVYGTLIVTMMMARPEGLVGRYRFERGR